MNVQLRKNRWFWILFTKHYSADLYDSIILLNLIVETIKNEYVFINFLLCTSNPESFLSIFRNGGFYTTLGEYPFLEQSHLERSPLNSDPLNIFSIFTTLDTSQCEIFPLNCDCLIFHSRAARVFVQSSVLDPIQVSFRHIERNGFKTLNNPSFFKLFILI